MSSPLSIQRTLDVVVFTTTKRLEGGFRSQKGRLADSVNMPLTGQLSLQPVTCRSLFSSQSDTLVASSIMFKRETAILMMLQGGMAADGDPPANVYQERSPYPAVVEAGPFTVSGEVRPLNGRTVQQYIFETALPFLAVTSAEVVFHPDPASNFSSDFVLVGRQWITAVVEGVQRMTDSGMRVSGR